MRAVKPAVRAVAVLVFLFLVALTPLPVGAQTPADVQNTNGPGAQAVWEYTDGGITTSVSVIVFDGTFLAPPQPGGTVPSRVVTVSIFRGDALGNLIESSVGITEENAPFEFTVASDLSTAHLSATIQVFDEIEAIFHEAVLDLNWAATGGLETEAGGGASLPVEAGLVVTGHGNVQQRQAVATGTVLYKGENFTPIPSTLASTIDQVAGSVIVQPENPTP